MKFLKNKTVVTIVAGLVCVIILGFAIEMLGCFDFIKKILLVNKNAEEIAIKNDCLFISMILVVVIMLVATAFFVGLPLKMN